MRNPCKHPPSFRRDLTAEISCAVKIEWCRKCGATRRVYRQHNNPWSSPTQALQPPAPPEKPKPKPFTKADMVAKYGPPRDYTDECKVCNERFECDRAIPTSKCDGYTTPNDGMVCPVCVVGTVYDEGHHAYCDNELCEAKWEI